VKIKAVIVLICCLTILYTLNNVRMGKVIFDGDNIGDNVRINNNNTLNDCINVRGTNGYWFRDEDFARKTFHDEGYRSHEWKKQNKNASAVYPGNQFNWKDTSLRRNDKHCQIHPVNRSSFCDIMQKHQIRRILFVGDSLTMAQYRSFAYLIYETPIRISHKHPLAEDIIKCHDFSIKIQLMMGNLGPNLGVTNITGRDDAKNKLEFGHEIPYCYGDQSLQMGYCPWHLLYNATNEKSLLILNQGPHFHSLQTFSDSFDKFVQLFNSIAHPGDIVVFRNTVPGHYDCWNEHNSTISPLNMTHDKFLARYGTNLYDWNLFDAYNSHAKKRLHDLTPNVTSHYLNVYNMTVLRSDQHMARTDCLHYSGPGPVDFWNHLLFSNLADMNLDKHIS